LNFAKLSRASFDFLDVRGVFKLTELGGIAKRLVSRFILFADEEVGRGWASLIDGLA
jgi:hypothetical protein